MATESVGAVWKRQGKYGEALYIKVTINGETYAFYANKSKYTGEGKPDFYLVKAPKPQPQQPVEQEQGDDAVPF